MINSIWLKFLKDIFICSLGSYGGPEAHYGVMSSILVERKKYLTEEELTEFIGLFALVPGPSSTQTITAIGYYVGGPLLAFLSFLVWVLPAIVIMSLIGVFFTHIDSSQAWEPLITYLPAAAVAFIIYAAFSISRKVLNSTIDWLFYLFILTLGLLFASYSIWVVPVLLILGGFAYLFPHLKEFGSGKSSYRPRWIILVLVIGLALINERLIHWVRVPWLTLYTSFYRYGYSVIGGGQIVIPLMIQDFVQSQSLISLQDFLAGYAIDQAVPGPLFSFAAFVSSRSFAGSGYSFLAGILGGFSIFAPGIMLVYFIFPIWKTMTESPKMSHFLRGVTVTAAGLIAMTAVNQIIKLPADIFSYIILIVATLMLLSKKIPAPIIVLGAAFFGFII